MKKISLLFLALLTLFACKKDSDFNSNPLIFKEYIAGFTSGLISSHTQLNILLNQPIPQDKLDKVNELNLFEISPKVSGKVVAVNATQISFVPEKPLEQNTQYRVSFSLKRLTIV